MKGRSRPFTYLFGLAPIPVPESSRAWSHDFEKIPPNATTHAGCRPAVAAAQRAEWNEHASVQVSPAFSRAPPPGSRIFPQPHILPNRIASSVSTPRSLAFPPLHVPSRAPCPESSVLSLYSVYFITSISQHLILFCSFSYHAAATDNQSRATRQPIRRSGRPSHLTTNHLP